MTNLTHIVFKEVATAPWPYGNAAGFYRTRYFGGSDLRVWKESSAEEQVKHMSNKAKFERVDKATWDRAVAGELNGWSKTSDADAEVVIHGN